MKNFLPLVLSSLLVGCAKAPPATSDASTDGSSNVADSDSDAAGGGTTLPEGLYGTVPARELPAPEFVATNSDGTKRGHDDLVGAPHVVWFFPLAGTAG